LARQPALPALRNVAADGLEPRFAHSAEVDFGRLLTYYGIRWVYEPTTFALAWGPDGRPTECFTPDFYLPDQGLYIELTTMRQRLVTRKNRKVRRLRAIYPNVRVKLLYRRDCLRLQESYPAPMSGASPKTTVDGTSSVAAVSRCRLGPVLLAEAAIRRRVGELAAVLASELLEVVGNGGELPVVLTLGGGARRFQADLIERLLGRGVGIEPERIELSRYRMRGGMRRVRVRRPPRQAVAGRRVLVVVDVVSTGLSLSYLERWLRRRGAVGVEVCALLDRRSARLVDMPVRHVGFEAPADLLVGYGLPLHRRFRSLPFIATVEVDPTPAAGAEFLADNGTGLNR